MISLVSIPDKGPTKQKKGQVCKIDAYQHIHLTHSRVPSHLFLGQTSMQGGSFSWCTEVHHKLLKKDGSLTFHHRNIHQVAIEMYKVKHDLSPPFMKEIFTYISNENGTRSGDTFARPNVDSVSKGDQSLRSFGPIVWNTMIPGNLKESKSLGEFKNRIKSWTPKNCPCKLCKTYIAGLGYTNVVE